MIRLCLFLMEARRIKICILNKFNDVTGVRSICMDCVGEHIVVLAYINCKTLLGQQNPLLLIDSAPLEELIFKKEKNSLSVKFIVKYIFLISDI